MSEGQDEVFATLTPTNVMARVAFSEVVDELLRQHQRAASQDPDTDLPSLLRHGPEQIFDRDILRFRLQSNAASVVNTSFSESPTEPGTDAEEDYRQLGLVWPGSYVFTLAPPLDPAVGWIAGKSTRTDLCLAPLSFAKQSDKQLRTSHARFNFDPRTCLFLVGGMSRAMTADVTVNGSLLPRLGHHALNQQDMKIRISALEYTFRFTAYASTDEYLERRREYIAAQLLAVVGDQYEWPTPSEATRTFGQWTISQPLGRGTSGHVYRASNSALQLVAIKILIKHRRTARSVDREIHVLRALTSAAEEAFEELALALEPFMPLTLTSICSMKFRRGTIPLDSGRVFHEALLGLRFLHSRQWLHGDLKPDNIGISMSPVRAVLLDLGGAQNVASGALPPTPGAGGTIGYLSPEREMREYGLPSDIWAMGVIGFELSYGRHPWRFSLNPYRPGPNFQSSRPAFNGEYEKGMRLLREGGGQVAPGQLDLRPLLIQMLSHTWASENNSERINIDDLLQHETWLPLRDSGEEEGAHHGKRQKT